MLLCFLIGCNGQSQETVSDIPTKKEVKNNDSIKITYLKTLKEVKLDSDSSTSYGTIKSLIKEKKLELKEKELSIDSLAAIFKISLVNRILPFWEGTEWSFEGHTATPTKGQIACGYFVSTTLKDVGINLNRYRLAQQSPVNEARSLAISTEVIEIAGNSIKENILKINTKLQEGIHFIGFDASHVGYILKEKGQLYLIHSNYIDSKGVEIEKIETSNVFASYNKYYLTELSTNEDLLKRWLDGNEIKVIPQK